MHMQSTASAAIPATLATILRGIPRAALGFSGGVDSAYLLYAARHCGVALHAYFVHTPFQPAFELQDARHFAALHAVPLTVIQLDILQNTAISSNPPNRCYHCKHTLFGQIKTRATADGYPVLLDGSNASDDPADRPGMRALQELSVLSPLRQAGLTKQQVRENARQAGLSLWNKPAYACLATRIPTGMPLTVPLLSRVEHAEDTLYKLGFSHLRVRVKENGALLQFPVDQLPRATAMHAQLVSALSPWFSSVQLDPTPRPHE